MLIEGSDILTLELIMPGTSYLSDGFGALKLGTTFES